MIRFSCSSSVFQRPPLLG